jgi:hypothetical protein
MSEQGRPKYFSMDLHVQSIKQMIRADELEFALQMIKNVPGYYRDHYSKELNEIKDRLYRNIWTTKDYSGDKDEADSTRTFAKATPINEFIDEQNWSGQRGVIIKALVKTLNEKGETPHIYEFGPANFFIPYGLARHDAKFTYDCFSINQNAEKEAGDNLKGYFGKKPKGPVIFVCFEVIEHLWNQEDIYHAYVKSGLTADYILLSTPLYTLNGGMEEIDRELGHLRTYTPKEFTAFAQKCWPLYHWEGVNDWSINLMGKRAGL